MRPVCVYPGCEATLDVRNTSSVCQKHRCHKPHCTCIKCAKGRPPAKAEPLAIAPEDAWKGEHLIRNRRRANRWEGNGYSLSPKSLRNRVEAKARQIPRRKA